MPYIRRKWNFLFFAFLVSEKTKTKQSKHKKTPTTTATTATKCVAANSAPDIAWAGSSWPQSASRSGLWLSLCLNLNAAARKKPKVSALHWVLWVEFKSKETCGSCASWIWCVVISLWSSSSFADWRSSDLPYAMPNTQVNHNRSRRIGRNFSKIMSWGACVCVWVCVYESQIHLTSATPYLQPRQPAHVQGSQLYGGWAHQLSLLSLQATRQQHLHNPSHWRGCWAGAASAATRRKSGSPCCQSPISSDDQPNVAAAAATTYAATATAATASATRFLATTFRLRWWRWQQR